MQAQKHTIQKMGEKMVEIGSRFEPAFDILRCSNQPKHVKPQNFVFRRKKHASFEFQTDSSKMKLPIFEMCEH